MQLPRPLERRLATRSLAALAAPAAATGLGLAIGSGRTTAAALLYLLGVVGAATVSGLWPGIAASLLSFLGLNFFFTPPRHALSVSKVDDLVALVVFASVGMIVSTLVALGRAQQARAERREYEARSLYAISQRLLGPDDPEAGLGDLARLLRSLFGLGRCEVHARAADGTLELRAADGDAAAGAEPVVIPLATGERDLGALSLFAGPAGLGEAERRVATIFAQQTASALERAALERAAGEARIAFEADRVRRALLGAVSHDFRTPLASIKASITALTSPDAANVSAGDAAELLQTALEETERLERLVSNLLDLTRIRSGALAPDRVDLPVEDVFSDTLSAMRRALGGHTVTVMVRPGLPPVSVDPVQIGQVFRNVLENAAKFSPPGGEIRLSASLWQDSVEVRVSDEGAGVDPREREAVFEEFYRGGDGRAAGTGLGLAVARAIVRAHGGEIWIEGSPAGGATVAIRLPAAKSP